MNRKQEVQVNLVRKIDSDSYRIITDNEMMNLKISGRLHFEKSLVDVTKKGKKYFCSCYIQA